MLRCGEGDRPSTLTTSDTPFVTLSLDAGASLRDVQDAAGHADPRTNAEVRPGAAQPGPTPDVLGGGTGEVEANSPARLPEMLNHVPCSEDLEVIRCPRWCNSPLAAPSRVLGIRDSCK